MICEYYYYYVNLIIVQCQINLILTMDNIDYIDNPVILKQCKHSFERKPELVKFFKSPSVNYIAHLNATFVNCTPNTVFNHNGAKLRISHKDIPKSIFTPGVTIASFFAESYSDADDFVMKFDLIKMDETPCQANLTVYSGEIVHYSLITILDKPIVELVSSYYAFPAQPIILSGSGTFNQLYNPELKLNWTQEEESHQTNYTKCHLAGYTLICSPLNLDSLIDNYSIKRKVDIFLMSHGVDLNLDNKSRSLLTIQLAQSPRLTEAVYTPANSLLTVRLKFYFGNYQNPTVTIEEVNNNKDTSCTDLRVFVAETTLIQCKSSLKLNSAYRWLVRVAIGNWNDTILIVQANRTTSVMISVVIFLILGLILAILTTLLIIQYLKREISASLHSFSVHRSLSSDSAYSIPSYYSIFPRKVIPRVSSDSSSVGQIISQQSFNTIKTVTNRSDISINRKDSSTPIAKKKSLTISSGSKSNLDSYLGKRFLSTGSFLSIADSSPKKKSSNL